MPSYESVIKGEYIGKIVEINYVRAHNNKNDDNIKQGLIIDETKNTFKIKNKKGTKTFLKKNIILSVKDNDESYKVLGRTLIGKPEERLKKKKRRMW